MNLKQSPRKNGRIYLSIEKSYRDKATGKPKAKTVKSLGYLDVLKNEYDDPIAHFKKVARKMTEEENSKRKLTLSINMDEQLDQGTDDRKNFGYVAILKLYHELGLHRFLNNKARKEAFKFNTNSIMILLVISRLLSPGSKRRLMKRGAATLNVSTSSWPMCTGLFPIMRRSPKSSGAISTSRSQRSTGAIQRLLDSSKCYKPRAMAPKT